MPQPRSKVYIRNPHPDGDRFTDYQRAQALVASGTAKWCGVRRKLTIEIIRTPKQEAVVEKRREQKNWIDPTCGFEWRARQSGGCYVMQATAGYYDRGVEAIEWHHEKHAVKVEILL